MSQNDHIHGAQKSLPIDNHASYVLESWVLSSHLFAVLEIDQILSHQYDHNNHDNKVEYGLNHQEL